MHHISMNPLEFLRLSSYFIQSRSCDYGSDKILVGAGRLHCNDNSADPVEIPIVDELSVQIGSMRLVIDANERSWCAS